MEDQKIIQLYWDRDEQAIVETRDKYGGYCHNIAWNILQERLDTEECLNDTWLKAWNTMPTTWPAALMAYLGKITRNLAISLYRGRHAEKRGGGELAIALDELGDCAAENASVEHAVEGREAARQISRFLRSLPRTQCDLFVRRYWYLDSIEVLARSFGMSESKVKSMLFRTRKRLKAFLEKEGIV